MATDGGAASRDPDGGGRRRAGARALAIVAAMALALAAAAVAWRGGDGDGGGAHGGRGPAAGAGAADGARGARDADGGAAVARRGDVTGPPDGGAAGAVARAPATIFGRVVDAAGRPVAGATVTAVGAGAGALGGESRVEASGELGVVKGPIPFPPPVGATVETGPRASTGADGRFEIAGVVAARVSLVARHPDFIDGRSAELAVPAGGRVEASLALAPGAHLAGRVVDERGPLPGAEVWRVAAAGAAPHGVASLAAISDGAGRFELRGLTGRVDVELRARGHLASRVTLDPAMGDVDLHLASAAGRITGVVVDERGFPVRGARVALVAATDDGAAAAPPPASASPRAAAPPPGAAQRSARTDGRGEFVFDDVPRGPLAIVARAERYPPARAPRVSAGDDARIVLVPGGGVAGEARDPRLGAAPPGLAVTLVDRLGQRHVAAVRDPHGRFELLAVAPGAATLRAEAPGYAPLTRRVDVPLGESASDVTVRDLRLELRLGGAVVGVVYDRSGAPVAGAVVASGEARTRSDAAGHFRLAPVAPGAATVVATVAGAAASAATVAPEGGEVALDLALR